MRQAREGVIRGLVTDSRDIWPDVLAGCVRGARHDGHHHAAAAVAAGAAALLVDRPARLPPDLDVPLLVVPPVRAVLGPLGALCAGDPAAAMQLVAVPGSNGKATTSTLLQTVLDQPRGSCNVVSTVGAAIGAHHWPTPGRLG